MDLAWMGRDELMAVIIDLDNVRTIEVYDDYTEPHCDQLKHVRFLHHDGHIIDVVAAKVDGLPDDVGTLHGRT
jgi:hypothetical protein